MRATFPISWAFSCALPCALALSAGVTACSGDDTTSTPAAKDASPGDALLDTTAPLDSGGGDAPADTNHDAVEEPDGACPVTWTAAPSVDPSIALPDGGGGVLLHAAATGTQDYTCRLLTAADGGMSYAWVFVGPEADLADCNAGKIGKHFASDAGAAAPEWQTTDGTYVIGKKVAAFTPDGGAGAIPWLLVQETSVGGTGTLSKTAYIQRLNTTGGVAPAAATCDVNASGTTQKVNYTADYFFFGQ